MAFDKLFEPIQIGDVTIKNRIAMAPMNPGLAGPFGYHTDVNTAWYAARARGGFGLLITECCVMNPHPWNGSEILNPSLFTDYRYYRYHSDCVKFVHEFSDCKIFMQLSPGWGRQGHPHVDTPGCPSGAPSPIPMQVDMRNLNKGWERQLKRVNPLFAEFFPDFDAVRNLGDEEYAEFITIVHDQMAANDPDSIHTIWGDVPREMTIAEIEDLENRFAVQAKAAFAIEYDGIEVHAPHGYLLHSFLSPRSNQRHDKYGGSLENRARFLLNIVEKTRAEIGPDKAFGVRLSGDELMPGGITHDEVKQVVAWCKDAGANFFNISQGSYENPGAAFAPDGEGGFAQWAEGFKKASGGLPIITPSYINPGAAEDEIKTGNTDIISLGRQAIADPFWPAKVKEGRLDDIVKCVRCQRCYMNLMINHWLECSVNPTAGREKHYPELWLHTPKLDKKVDRFIGKTANLPQI